MNRSIDCILIDVARNREEFENDERILYSMHCLFHGNQFTHFPTDRVEFKGKRPEMINEE